MCRAIDVAGWLRGLPDIKNVRPCRITIGKQSWEGAFYIRVCQWQSGMDGVTRGEHKVGEEYEEVCIYLYGIVPDHKRTCYPYEGKDWYVACYSDPKVKIKPEHEVYNPFGHSFLVRPWDISGHPESKIDTYEPRSYKRVPMTVEWLDDTN